MIDREQFLSIVALMRRAANQEYAGDLAVLLGGIEKEARERLRDLPLPDPNDVVEYLIGTHNGRIQTLCRTTPPGADWDFSDLKASNGIRRLTDLLRPHYREAIKKPSSRESKQYLRWYPAAEVLLYCAHVRRCGPRNNLVDALIGQLATMTWLEESIGAKLRRKVPRGPTAKTREIVQCMASRLAANSGLSQTQAADFAFRKDGLGTSRDANLQIWKRWAKKLGHQA